MIRLLKRILCALRGHKWHHDGNFAATWHGGDCQVSVCTRCCVFRVAVPTGLLITECIRDRADKLTEAISGENPLCRKLSEMRSVRVTDAGKTILEEI